MIATLSVAIKPHVLCVNTSGDAPGRMWGNWVIATSSVAFEPRVY